MDGRIEEISATVAAVTRAAGTALDPSAILQRSLNALGPAVSVAAASLWLGEGDDLQLAASYPDDDAAVTADSVVIPLGGPDRGLGHLAASAGSGRTFSDGERALLDIAASQIAGSLERSRLFQEVMELERLKSDFIARVSHELRTPITIIKGFLDTMLAHEDTLGPEQRHHMLERSHLAASRLSRLIEELLILSRLDAGVLTPEPTVAVVQTVLDDVRESATEPDQVLLSAPAGATVTTDPVLLARALGLVVDNAIKYGGTAEVAALPPAGAGAGWTFEVRDRGAGFAEDVRDTAFEMFARSHGTTAIPGLGVGLPIARTLVEVLDGDISIDHAHAGTGALVRITLPASA
ncbi:MAG: histidine kinase dimerization/phospho-acceptor domain-containing protein [Acidimicrobiales bacterium]